MNKLIFSAAILSLITLFVHIFAGGQEIHIPILESKLSVGMKAILSVVWHMATAMLIMNSIALLIAARSPDYQKPLILLIASQYLSASVLFVYYGYFRLDSLMLMPQWIAFSSIAALALTGLYKKRIYA